MPRYEIGETGKLKAFPGMSSGQTFVFDGSTMHMVLHRQTTAAGLPLINKRARIRVVIEIDEPGVPETTP